MTITETNETLYSMIYRIRKFEETVLENFPKGVFWGTTHTYIGQEANAVGVLSHLQEDDIVFSNHRSHGHFIAYGGDMSTLFAELMGKPSGVCGGRGGSQHLHWKNFYSNGIQGGIAPIATGMALAEKYKNTGAIAIAFLGDGTFGEGIVYETLNLASLWKAPILFVVENNHIAQTTPENLTIAGKIRDRFSSFGVSVVEMDTSDVLDIYQQAGKSINEVRENKMPYGLVLNTYRFGPHSKGDDTRNPQVLKQIIKTRDPLRIQAERVSVGVRENITKKMDDEVLTAYKEALEAPLFEDIYENSSDDVT
ncbi:MAG TPA: thiamine pyrophosphate-dependent dehydrogenase E1 component subunit alpha [Anaerolineae bacterium]|nr:thiamine pyrophosphate-dependent dehydrogenase E1 component subunit alpha [Anaerolineae bacterium]